MKLKRCIRWLCVLGVLTQIPSGYSLPSPQPETPSVTASLSDSASAANVTKEGTAAPVAAPNPLKLSAEELAWLAQHPIINTGYEANYAPIEMTEAGKRSGITSDYMAFFQEQLKPYGVTLTSSTKGAWKSTYQAFIDKEYDILTCILKTENRAKLFLFSKPYMRADNAIITTVTNAQQELSITDIHGKSVAIIEGYFWEELLGKEQPLINQVLVGDFTEGLTKVAFGSADAFIGPMGPITHYLSENNISNLAVAGLTPYTSDYRMAVRPDWPELQSILDKLIKAMPAKAQQAIKDKWIHVDKKERVQNNQIAYLLLAALTLFAIGLTIMWMWNTALKRKVKLRTYELERVNSSLETKVKQRTRELEAANKELEISQFNLRQKNANLKDIALTDSLTQINNRRNLDQFLNRVFRDTEHIFPAVFMLIDIDHFKQYNDFYGHVSGDECLAKVATALSNNIRRENEIVARYGGEEFAIFIANCTAEQAKKIANRKRADIAALNIPHGDSSIAAHVTASIGYTTVSKADLAYIDVKAMIDRADKALYKAKASGRNKAVAFHADANPIQTLPPKDAKPGLRSN